MTAPAPASTPDSNACSSPSCSVRSSTATLVELRPFSKSFSA
jgi:hypothetical protein